MAKSKHRKNHKKKLKKRKARLKNLKNKRKKFFDKMQKEFNKFVQEKLSQETQEQLPDTFSKEDADKLKDQKEFSKDDLQEKQ